MSFYKQALRSDLPAKVGVDEFDPVALFQYNPRILIGIDKTTIVLDNQVCVIFLKMLNQQGNVR